MGEGGYVATDKRPEREQWFPFDEYEDPFQPGRYSHGLGWGRSKGSRRETVRGTREDIVVKGGETT